MVHGTFPAIISVSRLLSTAQGSLLDDEVLVNTLQSSKKTSEDVSEQLVVAEQTEAKIDAAREVYIQPSQALLYSKPSLLLLQSSLGLFLCVLSRDIGRAHDVQPFSSS